MNISPADLTLRLEAARRALERLRTDTNLPLELQLAICRTLYEIEQLTVQLEHALRTG